MSAQCSLNGAAIRGCDEGSAAVRRSPLSGVRSVVRRSPCLEILGDGRGRLLQRLHQVGRVAVILRRDEGDGCALVPCPPYAAGVMIQNLAMSASDAALTSSHLQSGLLKTNSNDKLRVS